LSTTQIIVNEVSLDTFKGEGFPVKITKQINDLRKLVSRNASFTSQISFPRTAKNTGALSGLTPTFKNSKVTPTSLSCVILMNGVTVLSGGRFTLSSKADDRYKGTVFFGNFDFFNLIEGDISELQWATYDQAWERADVDAIKATTTGIVFALASWFRPFGVQSLTAGSVWNTKHDINFSGFHVYARTIITNIIQELGFTYDDSAVTDSLWDELAISCPITKFAISREVDDPLEAEWSKTATQSGTGGAQVMTFDTQIIDVDALFDNGNDKYDIDRTATIGVQLNECSGSFIGSGAATIHFSIRKNSVQIARKNISISGGGSFDFTFSTITTVENGDDLEIRISSSAISSWDVDDGFFRIEDVGAVADHSLNISIGEHIPQIPKKDFLRWVFALLNIQVETDSLSSTVTLKPFDAILTSPEQDWSKNLDISKAIDEGITLPYAQINRFEYFDNEQLIRTDTEGTYSITNPLLRQELILIKSGFGASDGAQRKGIYIRGTAVQELPVIIMHSERLAGMNTTAASAAFTIDSPGAEFTTGNYIEVGGEFRQISARGGDTSGTVSTAFSGNNASQPYTLRSFEVQELIPPRIARIVASQGNYDVVQGTEDVTTSIVGGKEAVFHDDLLWNNIIANSYQNLLDNVANPLIIKPRFRFEASEFAAIDMLKKVYLEQYASSFVINRILQYRSDGLCFVELIRIN